MVDISALPKAELHCHIEGSAHPQLILAQAAKYNVDPSHYVDSKKGYLWTDFTSFLQAYDFAASLFKSPEDYIELTLTYYRKLHKQNCIYGELFVSPDHATRIGCSYKTLIDAIACGMYKAKSETGIEGRIIVVGVRHADVSSVEDSAKLAVGNPHPLVTGFGMAGDERFKTQKVFSKAFEIARDAGLHTTVHAGEFCGPQSVIDALDALKVERIGHGVRAIEDDNLVTRLSEEKIPLEICVGSNIALNVYKNLQAHPLLKLKEAGCVVTLNSDDPPHFHSSLEDEYELAYQTGFDYNDLLQCTINSVKAAFVDKETQKKLLAKCTLENG